MARPLSKRIYDLFSATVIFCQSGRFVAFFNERSDIIANGDTEKEVLNNLRKMYRIALQAEKDGIYEKPTVDNPIVLPEDWKTKQSVVKILRT